jgi:CRISPR-associated protein Cas5t
VDQNRFGVGGEPPRSGTRYGLPFLGDNAFLIDKIQVLDEPAPARWYCRLDAEGGAVAGSTRLTSWIDRQDMSRTCSALYAPAAEASAEIPEAAWTVITPPQEPGSKSK